MFIISELKSLVYFLKKKYRKPMYCYGCGCMTREFTYDPTLTSLGQNFAHVFIDQVIRHTYCPRCHNHLAEEYRIVHKEW